MCGIAGWIKLSVDEPMTNQTNFSVRVRNQISKVLDLQNHRGPDAKGIWMSSDQRVMFGHNRLSIVELSDAGSQPMTDQEGDWVITYNGELYNYKALRARLENEHKVRFRGNSDTEVFMLGVKTWGIDEFLRLADGMFAAGLYSNKTGRFLLIRDRAGEKPLYYTISPQGLYFASELRPLRRGISETSPGIDHTALSLYLMLRYVPAPLTIYRGYKKLRPGNFLLVDPGKPPREYSYFSWDPHASEIPDHPKTFEQAVQVTEKLLTSALETRLMSEVPLGFFLSGGIDSTLTASLVRKYFGSNIATYTIGFEGDAKSEHIISEKTAKIVGAHHSTKIFQVRELTALSKEVIASMDEPNGDRSCIPTYLLCKHAKSEVTVALGGDGGDELFGGYQRYPGLNQRIGEEAYPRAVDGLLWYFTHRLPVVTPSEVFEILPLSTDGIFEVLEDLAVHLYPPTRPEIDIRYIDFKSYLPGAVLAKVDRMSMQSSLEVRTPFLTESILNFTNRLPHKFLYNGSLMKPILRELCNRLNLSHVSKLEKRGFGMPAEFLFESKDELSRRLTAAIKTIGRELNDHIHLDKLTKAATSHINALWATIVLGEWLEGEHV